MLLLWLVIATLFWGVFGFASLGFVIISPMLLTGAGSPTRQQWIVVGMAWTTPMIILLSLVGMWVCFALKWSVATLVFSALPLAVMLMGWLIFLAADKF